jgi:hypothetical protein
MFRRKGEGLKWVCFLLVIHRRCRLTGDETNPGFVSGVTKFRFRRDERWIQEIGECSPGGTRESSPGRQSWVIVPSEISPEQGRLSSRLGGSDAHHKRISFALREDSAVPVGTGAFLKPTQHCRAGLLSAVPALPGRKHTPSLGALSTSSPSLCIGARNDGSLP